MRPLLFALFFASGFAGLVYELLWVRELALVFGSTAEATATTLAVFFLGLSAGQYAAGRGVATLRRPLLAYAALEALVALTALATWGLLSLYATWAPALFARTGSDGSAATLVRLALGAGALAAPSFCMGATLPVMGQVVVRRADELARTFALLYAVQTIGGAAGALAGGFWLPGAIGYRRTYLLAVAVSAGVAALAYALGRRLPAVESRPARRTAAIPPPSDGGYRLAIGIACVSGFAGLALEVLWTHMFSQALHNSVYSFAAILVTFLAALGAGGLVARGLARMARENAAAVLAVLLVLTGVAVATTPFLFDRMTDGLRLLSSATGWPGYVRTIFTCAAAVMLLPAVLAGSVFPFTLRLAQRGRRHAGALIGELAAWNTAAAVAGSLCAGFVALPQLGLWSSLRATALLYVAAAVVAASRARRHRAPLLALTAVAAVLLLALLDPNPLPLVPLQPGEKLQAVYQSRGGTVAVTETGGVLQLKLDGHYTVGGSGAVANDRRQAELPMLLVPRPRSVFFLGLGTGISAGAALFHPVEQVTVAELVPAVARAAREYFAPYTAGLFTDPRVRIEFGDARTVLRAARQRYDVIVADLFVPWHAGVGNMYTLEHFRAVRGKLAAGGLFAQWLPLYQMSWREFSVVARTMLDAFPQVTVWRGDFLPRSPIVALIGHAEARPLDLAAVVDNVQRRSEGEGYPPERARALALLFYGGNLSAAPALVADAPLNSEDRPVIEYLAPATPLDVVRGRAEWLTGVALSRFWERLAAAVPVDEDPYLAAVPSDERQYVDAGRMLHEASILRDAGRDEEARQAFEGFASRVPADIAAVFSGMVATR